MKTDNLEKEFGKDFKDKIKNGLIDDFCKGETTKVLFEEVCNEISSSSISSEELINKLKVFPANIALAIISKVRTEDKNESVNKLVDLYLYDFSCAESKGKEIKNRISFKVDAKERFIKERLITLTEVEYMIRKRAKETGEEISKALYVDFKYNGENETIKRLFDVREKLKRSTNSKKIDNMIDEIKQPLLKNLLEDIKSYNIEV